MGNLLSSHTNLVKKLENEILGMPQVQIETTHTLHAGTYARTIIIPSGVVLTGAQIKIPTVLIVSGDVMIGNERYKGYHVLEGASGRKNAFYALEDTYLTMIFATELTNLEDIENSFTDEAHKLGSRGE